MYRITLFASLLALLLPATADARKTHRDGCHSTACIERVARKQCSQTHVIACIRRAAIHHHQPFSDMVRVARCESGLDPSETYVGHVGLYQFLPSTWATTIYAAHSMWSAKWQALATAWMWKVGRRGEWSCQ